MRALNRFKIYVGIAAVGAIVLALSAESQAASIYFSGDGDIAARYEGGQIVPHWRINNGIVNGSPVTGTSYAADDMFAFVSDSTKTPGVTNSSSERSGATMLGLATNASYWKLEDSAARAAQDGAPYLGLEADQGFVPGDWSNVTFTLTGFDGPGEFALWRGTNQQVMATADGVTAADAYSFGESVGINTNPHFNWGFSQAGVYLLEITMSGLHDTDGAKSATGTYEFRVSAVPEPSSVALALAGAGLIGLAAWRRRKKAVTA